MPIDTQNGPNNTSVPHAFVSLINMRWDSSGKVELNNHELPTL